MAQTVKDVMTTSPRTLPANAPVSDAARAMSRDDIGDVIVVKDGSEICGIVTDRDIVLRVVAEGRDASATKLGEICTREIETLTPGDSVSQAVRLMSEKAIRRLPVVEKGHPVGIVSLGDLAVTQDPESALADISSAPPDE